MPRYRLNIMESWWGGPMISRDFMAKNDSEALARAKGALAHEMKERYIDAGDCEVHLKKQNPKTRRFRWIYNVYIGHDGRIKTDKKEGS